MSTLDGFKNVRNPHLERPYVNTSTSVAIKAGDVVVLDVTNNLAAQEAATPGQSGVGAIQSATASSGAASGLYALGVAIDAAPANVNAQFRVQDHGIIQVVAGATNPTIAAGAIVSPDLAGQVSAQTAGKPQLGVALTPAAAQGDLFLVQIAIANNA